MLYCKFSEYLKNKYKQKVYKLPINIPVTCPNRDGTIDNKGCIFCGEEGAGFESLPNCMSVTEQIEKNSKYIGENYNADKYIVYFQNYSNTYLPIDKFKKYILECIKQGIVAIYISTRPDCVYAEHMEFLENIKKQSGIDIVIELGLQTVNYSTLKFLNRGHTLAEFIDAVCRIKKYNLEVCAHYIVDLPMDSIDDCIEGAKILSALGVEQVKCHSLYILKGTKLGDLYSKGEIKPISLDEYLERIVVFIENLKEDIVIQRLVGRAPKERTLFCNWQTSWWKIMDMIERKMILESRYQGKGTKYNTFNGGIVNIHKKNAEKL